MLPQHRPSILWRPRGQPSQCNDESAETEYQRYQARLAALRERASAHESRLLSKLYPPSRKSQTHDDTSTHSQAGGEMIEGNQQSEKFPSRYAVQGMERPWCLEPEDNAEALRESIRRKESQAAMRENMEMADRKKKKQELERARERSITGSTVISEKQWWNYGAASDQWIAPEHRVRHRGSRPSYSESKHSGSGDLLHWHESTPRSSSQVSATSCNHTAPYATSENAPAMRRTGYRPRAPFHTEPDGGVNLTGQSQQPPLNSSRASSIRPPFSLHNEPTAAAGSTSRPQRHDPRLQSARSSAAPFDRDDQPGPPQRRAMFRTGYQPNSQCPFDREDLVLPPQPREYTATCPYATSDPPALQEDHVGLKKSGNGSLGNGGGPGMGTENAGAVYNRGPAESHAAGMPSPGKHPKDSLESGGGRLSPASVKHANEVTTEEVPLSYPFVATAAGVVRQGPERQGPHTPEAPRHLSRSTPQSLARRQAMQRGEGVDAAMHAYAGGGRASAAGSAAGSVQGHDDSTEAAGGGARRQPLVESLVAKHAGGSRMHGSEPHRQSRMGGIADGHRERGSVRGAPVDELGWVRAPYATLEGEVPWKEGGGQKSGVSGYTARRGGSLVSQGHMAIQPEWMHVERPAGKPTGRDALVGPSGGSRGGSDRDSVHYRDQVAKIMQHSEASLRAAPGGEMYGMIDKLSRKYGAHSLQ